MVISPSENIVLSFDVEF